ncbi:acyl-CoA dehydrogenase family protein [Deferrisoma camini]|uniref:acyl-CoA dehydrogenase family protein n=1 Tax=Deferrisoma camini TaxID=1035120 RepID=UPI00046D7962|nr:acyl-CoA dehydrogenase family protein [Deferrisoma camini]NOY45885.1 acyl-CoA dehydrogenase [Deltaproteobacteria bacterium]
MDFRLTEEQQFFRQAVADTVDRLILPRVEEIDQEDRIPEDLWREFTSLGYLGLRYPEELGGMNADPVTCMIFYEEITRGSVGFAQAVIMNMLMGTHFLYRFGSEAIRERCLLPALRGEKIATICFTEDQSGSDLAATRTTAKKVDGGWVLNGTKNWITNGPTADFATVLATTDPAKGMKGLNFFLVEKGTPGFRSGQVLHKLGARGPVTGELVFEDVFVPDENLLGEEEGKGVAYLGEILNEVRCMTGAMALGIARTAFADGLEYARKREAFGRPIGDYQLIRAKFAEMATEMEAARLLVYYAAWMIGEGLNPRKEAAMAKMFATETCLKVVDEVTRIYGGNGFATEYGPQRYFRDARFLLYGGGTHEVLKNFIGREIVKGR